MFVLTILLTILYLGISIREYCDDLQYCFMPTEEQYKKLRPLHENIRAIGYRCNTSFPQDHFVLQDIVEACKCFSQNSSLLGGGYYEVIISAPEWTKSLLETLHNSKSQASIPQVSCKFFDYVISTNIRKCFERTIYDIIVIAKNIKKQTGICFLRNNPKNAKQRGETNTSSWLAGTTIDSEDCKYKECTFGNLITDAYVTYISFKTTSAQRWTDYSVGLLPAGVITSKQKIYRGSFEKKDIITFVQEEKLCAFSSKGMHIKNALEVCAENLTLSVDEEAFIQVSGLEVIYDLGRPPGNRVRSVYIRCTDCLVPKYHKLDKQATYGLIGDCRILTAENGHYVFNRTFKNLKHLEETNIKALVWYVNANAFVAPEIRNRIQVVNLTQKNDSTQYSVFIILIVICILTDYTAM